MEHLACTGESINAHKMSVINSESKMSVLRLKSGWGEYDINTLRTGDADLRF